MYKIHYYKDKNGKSSVEEYIRELEKRTDKDSRIKLNKIHKYIVDLSTSGLSLGEPQIKHLDGEIWELRPLRDRILFVAWQEDGSFVLLHHFMKDTQKTPQREIDKAKREYKELLERGLQYE